MKHFGVCVEKVTSLPAPVCGGRLHTQSPISTGAYWVPQNIRSFRPPRKLLPERCDRPGTAAHPPQRPACCLAQLPVIFWTDVGQLVLFPMPPDVLDRIQLGRVRRQVRQFDAAMQTFDVVPDQPAAMRRPSDSNHHQPARNVADQGPGKLHHLRPFRRSSAKPEIRIQRRQSRHCRQTLPVEVVLQHRSPSARRLGAAPMGALTQSALVYEDHRPPFPAGFFKWLTKFSSSRREGQPRCAPPPCRWVAADSCP